MYSLDMITSLHSDKLEVLGGMIALDRRVSWAPKESSGYQPSNAYLLSGDAGSGRLLIDTGLALHSKRILDGLAERIGEGGGISIFFTRAEMDCVSNLEPIASRFDVERLFTGGVINPFDAFADLSGAALRGRRHQVDRQRTEGGDALTRASSIVVAPGRILEIEAPLLRLLPTFWGWDAATGTLFTSDTFTHGVADRPDGPRVLDSAADDNTTPEQVAAHLYAKYEWIPRSNCEPLREWLSEKFTALDPEMVAPTRGQVIKGKSLITTHLEMMLAALKPVQTAEVAARHHTKKASR